MHVLQHVVHGVKLGQDVIGRQCRRARRAPACRIRMPAHAGETVLAQNVRRLAFLKNVLDEPLMFGVLEVRESIFHRLVGLFLVCVLAHFALKERYTAGATVFEICT